MRYARKHPCAESISCINIDIGLYNYPLLESGGMFLCWMRPNGSANAAYFSVFSLPLSLSFEKVFFRNFVNSSILVGIPLNWSTQSLKWNYKEQTRYLKGTWALYWYHLPTRYLLRHCVSSNGNTVSESWRNDDANSASLICFGLSTSRMSRNNIVSTNGTYHYCIRQLPKI